MKKALKYIAFILFSTIFSFAIFYLYFFEEGSSLSFSSLGTSLAIMVIGPSLGFISSIVFLITNKFFLKHHQNKKKYYIIRILVYILIYILTSFSMFIPDLIYDFQSYFELV